jgi:hypothetical protein
MKIVDGKALTDDGLVVHRTYEIGGTTFEACAYGPSGYNGSGSFHLRKVNTDEDINGGFTDEGLIAVTSWGNSLIVTDPDHVAALANLCRDPEFVRIGELVRECRDHNPVVAGRHHGQ